MIETVARLASINLRNERSIWIREPAKPATSTNLTVFLDAELYRDRVGAGSVIDPLLARRDVADSWFVFVSTESVESRWLECPCYPPFAKFVAEELLAFLERLHPQIKKATRRTLVGLSYTGLAAAYIAMEFPGRFQRAICQSGSFWWNDCWLIRQYGDLPEPPPTDFYCDVGSRETQENVRHHEDVLQVVSQIEGVKRFRDLLVRRGSRVKYVEFEGGHDPMAWRETLPGALRWALPG